MTVETEIWNLRQWYLDCVLSVYLPGHQVVHSALVSHPSNGFLCMKEKYGRISHNFVLLLDSFALGMTHVSQCYGNPQHSHVCFSRSDDCSATLYIISVHIPVRPLEHFTLMTLESAAGGQWRNYFCHSSVLFETMSLSLHQPAMIGHCKFCENV